MSVSISVRQNCIYGALIFLTALMTIGLYRTTNQEWLFFRNAEKKYAAKEYAEAIDLYRKSLAEGLPPSKIGSNLPNALVATGQFEEAIVLYRTYLLLHPQDSRARLSLAKALSWTGKLQEAEVEYQKLLEDAHENQETK
jgi:tetratricopeptide (TPR) repeat protein